MDMSIGQRVVRKDARSKVEGLELYVDDLSWPNLHYAAIVRSSVSHAEISKVFIKPGVSLPSGTQLITFADIPGKNIVHIILDDMPLLAESVVRYVGEPIAIIVSKTKENATKSLDLVEVKYKSLPTLLDPFEAINHPDIHIYGDDNIFTYHKMRKGDVKQGFEDPKIKIIVENTYRTPAQEHAYIEPQGVMAVPEPDGGMTIYGSMQCPYYARTAVSEILGQQLTEIRIVQAATGGGFGGKEDIPSQIAGLAAVAAKFVKKPVKLIYSREEDIETTSKRHPGFIKHKTAATADGRLVAAEVEYIIDSGAYSTLSPPVLWRGTLHAVGPYRYDHVKVDSFAVATNKVPNGAFRGFGSPQVLFAVETQLDIIAEKLGIDPVELRAKNLIRVGDELVHGEILSESVGAHKAMEKTLDKAQWEKKWKPPPSQVPLSGRHSGIGISTIFYGVGLGAGGKAKARTGAYVQVESDGSVWFSVGTTEIGQGMTTVLSQIVSDELGVGYANVRMSQVDTSRVPDSGPTVASRSTVMSGKALQNACSIIRETLLDVAKDILNCTMDDLEYGHLVIKTKDGREISILEVVEEATMRKLPLAASGWDSAPETDWDAETGRGTRAYFAYAFATNIAEVSVDVETGEVQVLRVYTAHDVGRAINPTTLEGQIEGGTVQGVGFGRFEEILWDTDGVITTKNLGTFIIPTILDSPEIYSMFVEEGKQDGPFGAKGIGEQPLMGVAPAITNAIHNAIGVRIFEIPATPERVWKAIQERRNES